MSEQLFRDGTAKRASFPHFANYCVPFNHLFTRGLEMEYIIPPPMTKRTMELGARYSPDYVCAPFKIHLGGYIEALEMGANTLLQLGGLCRLLYYGELHEQILRDLGYEFDFINLARVNLSRPQSLFEEFKRSNSHLSVTKASAAMMTTLKMVECIDELEDFMRRNIGFADRPESFEEIHGEYLAALMLVEDTKELNYLHKNYMKRMKAVPVKLPEKPLRVGVVGEYYSVMDPFSNHSIEQELAKKGVLVDRWMNVSNSLFYMDEREMLGRIKGYAKYNMGAIALSTVERALKFAKKNYDGIIHMKSFGCTPEMDAMPVLQNISRDYKIPILYFSFDSQTSDTGIQTRLEAFYDMMIMRKDSIA